MENIETSEQLKDFIKKNYAVSYDELLQNVALPQNKIDALLEELCEDKKISKEVKNSIYYVSNDGLKVLDFEHAYNTFGQIIINSKEIATRLKSEMEKLQKNINHFYINIITIMGVFVAMFSLITVNIKEISAVAKNPNLSAVGTCLIIDISVVIIIGAMLYLIKKIIISPTAKK